MKKPNKHGVYAYSDCENVLLFRDTWRNSAVIHLVETPDGWKYGVDVRFGGCCVGGGGFGHLPMADYGRAYPTRTAAETAARDEIVRRLRKKERVYLPSTASGVKRDINKIVKAVAVPRQMELF